jgi:hypothetical protein
LYLSTRFTHQALVLSSSESRPRSRAHAKQDRNVSFNTISVVVFNGKEQGKKIQKYVRN